MGIKRLALATAMAWMLWASLSPAHAGLGLGLSIKMGVQGPMSGALAKQGRDMANAVRLAVDERNNNGGLNGQRIEVLIGDDKGDPREGILAARQLATAGVMGVVGPYNSGVAIPVTAEVYHPAGIPVLTVATNPRVTDRGLDTVFRIIGRDDQQGRVAAEKISRLSYKRVAVLHNKNAYGQGLGEEFSAAFKRHGGQVLIFEGITSGDKDFTPALTRLKPLHPDLIYFGGEYQDAGPLLRQARRLGLQSRFLSGDATLDPSFIELAGQKAAEGALVTFPQPASSTFEAKYRARFGDPGAYCGYAYDAANLLLHAASKAAEPQGRLVVRQLAMVRDFPGVTGRISFDPKGDLKRAGFILWEVKGGRWNPIR